MINKKDLPESVCVFVYAFISMYIYIQREGGDFTKQRLCKHCILNSRGDINS